MKMRLRMTMSMHILYLFVWMTCLWVSRSVVSATLDLSHLPQEVSNFLPFLLGGLFASFFLWHLKLPDGRYLFRPWTGENLQFATPMQLTIFYLALLATLSPLIYALFWY